MTVLKNNSFSSTWIRERLESAGVRLDFIQLSQHLPESGFVGLRSDGTLKTAVTSTAVGEHTFQTRLIDKAMLHARFLVLDCNLAVDQMSLLLTTARRQNIPTVVAAVSDSKVVRLLQLGQREPADLVVLNKLELDAILQGTAAGDAKQVCNRLGAKHVVLTAGADGYSAMSESGWSKHYDAPQVDAIVSQSGAGDALLAGLVTHWFNAKILDFDDAVPTVANSVRRVLEQPGATRGALATDIDFARLARIAVRNEPFWKRFLSPEVGVAAAIIGTVLTVAILILTYMLLPEAQSHSATGSTTPATETPRSQK